MSAAIRYSCDGVCYHLNLSAPAVVIGIESPYILSYHNKYLTSGTSINPTLGQVVWYVILPNPVVHLIVKLTYAGDLRILVLRVW